MTGGPSRPTESKEKTGKQSKAIDSLAILPLENASGDPETEYLSDGIAETLINTLAQLRKIRVVPRAVAFQYRGPGVNPLTAGRELGVRTVLAGRMVQRGNDLIVSLELVDVDRQGQLWGGRFNRRMTDLIALQEELATEIYEKLRLQLSGEDKKNLRKRPTQNNEAYRLLLRAQHCFQNEYPAGLPKAVSFCQQAVEKDPLYAPAYAELAGTYVELNAIGMAPASEVLPLARRAARKAIELDETLGEAHISLGLLYAHDWDFAASARELRRGLELSPDSPRGNYRLTQTHWSRGRLEEAIVSARRFAEVDPGSWIPNFMLGTTFYFAGAYDEAITEYHKAIRLDPQNPQTSALLADTYACAGQKAAALEQCERVLVQASGVQVLVLHVAATYALLGKIAEAREILDEAERKWRSGDASAVWIAGAHARLGDRDLAFEWLDRAVQEHELYLLFLRMHRFMESLRGDPRFDALVKRIGLPD